MAAEHWFRWHHGSVTDPKWRVIASRCVTSVTVGHVVTVWAAMLENASQAAPRGTLSGWDDEDIAVLFGYEVAQVSAIREAMQGKVLDGDTILSWGKRQPGREDSSAGRTREYRERQRHATRNDVTQCDAVKRTVTLETETETEKAEAEAIRGEGSPPFGVHQPIVDAYHELLPNCQTISTPTPHRLKRLANAAKLAKRVCASNGWTYEPATFWHGYFAVCANDPWLRGDVANPNNARWKQNLDVLLADERLAQVIDQAINSLREAE